MIWVYIIGGVLVLMVVASIGTTIRMWRIAQSRSGETFENFRASFEPDEAPLEVIRAVYAKFQQWCQPIPAFPVRAEDVILDIYGIDDEDFDDLVLEAVAECGRVLPPDEQMARITPIVFVTVRDLVRYVAECPRATSSKVPASSSEETR